MTCPEGEHCDSTERPASTKPCSNPACGTTTAPANNHTETTTTALINTTAKSNQSKAEFNVYEDSFTQPNIVYTAGGGTSPTSGQPQGLSMWDRWFGGSDGTTATTVTTTQATTTGVSVVSWVTDLWGRVSHIAKLQPHLFI